MTLNILNLIISFFIFGSFQAEETSDLAQKMIDVGIVPHYFRHPPHKVCKVVYPYGEVHPGEEWLCNRTMDIPKVTWEADPNAYYCLYFGTIDRFDQEVLLYQYTRRPITTPSVAPINTHDLWVVTNIPGNNLAKGNTILYYARPGPPVDETAIEYYVFLVYKQPTNNMTVAKVEFMQSGVNVPDTMNLTKFEIDYNLGKPVAGNFFFLSGKGLWEGAKDANK